MGLRNVQKTGLSLLGEVIIIMGFYFFGEGVVWLLDSAVAGSVIGMLALLSALHLGWVKVDHIRYVSSFLLSFMPYFFIPAGVSVMVSYKLLAGHYVEVFALIMLSTIVVMVLTGYVVQFFVNRSESKDA